MNDFINPTKVLDQLKNQAEQYAKDYVKTYPEAKGTESALVMNHFTCLVNEFRNKFTEKAKLFVDTITKDIAPFQCSVCEDEYTSEELQELCNDMEMFYVECIHYNMCPNCF